MISKSIERFFVRSRNVFVFNVDTNETIIFDFVITFEYFANIVIILSKKKRTLIYFDYDEFIYFNIRDFSKFAFVCQIFVAFLLFQT